MSKVQPAACPPMNRRTFLVAGARSALALATGCATSSAGPTPRFRLSLAQWSLRDRLRAGTMANVDFPRIAQDEFGIPAVEYVSTFFEGRERERTYLNELRGRAGDAGVRNVLIMVDLTGEDGHLASRDPAVRRRAADAHRIWIDAARALGCNAIRVNAYGYGQADFDSAQGQFVDGLRLLVAHGREAGVRVLVENHGGFSSHGGWLAGVMRAVDDPYCGTLPDFGNFTIDREAGTAYDPIQGVRELMPFAGGVSAKAHAFSADGLETTIDYPALLDIVRTSSFSGYIGIEWGGRGNLTPEAGIRGTRRLLKRFLGAELHA